MDFSLHNVKIKQLRRVMRNNVLSKCTTGVIVYLPFLLESRLTLLGLTAGCSSVSVDILRLQLD